MSRPRVALKVAGKAEAAAGRPACAEPCVVVIFGGTGDLSRRKLLPSLFHLKGDGLLDDVAIIGVGRDKLGDDGFRQAARKALEEFAPKDLKDDAWRAFAATLYHVAGDLDDAGTYQRIAKRIEELGRTLPAGAGRLFYFAIPPALYETVSQQLSASGLAPRTPDTATRPWTRLIIEKPFGRDLTSARALNKTMRGAFGEHQVYRIDHYLGKETVQNMMVLRFGNAAFEPLWNHQYVEQVQITAAETVGVEHRAGYYEPAGVVRDMFQNHLLQLLTLTAMERPKSLDADAVRDRKLEVLRAIRPIGADGWDQAAVRGQYGPGTIGGTAVPGYRDEPDVAKESATPTFAAVRLFVDAPRWQGVPFLLRSGKRLAAHASEIAVTFRRPPHELFRLPDGQPIERNVLVIQVQPKEGIALRFEVKVPGTEFEMVSADLDFAYADAFTDVRHDAYETLLLDAMRGDATLFTRHDEVEAAWSVVDPLVAYWEHGRAPHFPNYAAGSWGPDAAEALVKPDGIAWRQPPG